MTEIGRRILLARLGAAIAATACPRAAGAAPARLGLLLAGSKGAYFTDATTAIVGQGLHDAGLRDGRDYQLDVHYAGGDYQRLGPLAQGLAASGAALILANTIAGVRAAQAALPTRPVVMLGINNPVESGLIATLARPGGQTTGIATQIEDMTPKMLDFQRQIVPRARRIGVVLNPANPSNQGMLAGLQAGATGHGIAVVPAAVRLPGDLDAALATLAAADLDALHLLADAASLDLCDRIAPFALSRRLPFFAPYPPAAEIGGLLGFGPVPGKLLGRAGYFVRRILDGATPADLPVEQPTVVELWINLATARALGVEIPLTLQTADRIFD